MDRIYFAYSGDRPVIFKSVGKDKQRVYWGEPLEPDAKKRGKFVLGVRGKIWALALLARSRAADEPSVGELCRRIARLAEPKIADDVKDRANEEKRRKPASKEADLKIGELIYQLASESQKEACPPTEAATTLLEIVARYCESLCFPPSDTHENEGARRRFREAVHEPVPSPAKLYRKLQTLVPSAGAEPLTRRTQDRSKTRLSGVSESVLADLSQIEVSIDNGLTVPSAIAGKRRFVAAEREDEDDAIVTQALSALKDPTNRKPRLIVLSGRPFAGKKAKLLSLLRVIASREDNRLLIRLHSNTDEPLALLPVRAWSARDVHYRELVVNVVQFLDSYNAAAGDEPRAATPIIAPNTSLEELFEHVERLHKGCPTLFVFTDVDAFRADHGRNAIRDIGIRNLIETLIGSNRYSMVLITTSESLKNPANNPAAVGLPPLLEIPVEFHILEIGRFLRQEVRNSVPQTLFYQGFDGVRGDDLLSIAALINVSSGPMGPVFDSCRAFLNKPPDKRRSERAEIYRQLFAATEAAGMLHVMTLIAASVDGLRDDSLARLLEIWACHDGRVPTFRDAEGVREAVSSFSERAGARFVTRTRMARYDPEEYGFDEHHSEEDEVWEIDSLISAMFLESVHEIEPSVAQHANRLVASLARQRAQNKKALMRAPLGSRATEDASRDIQCYVSLLASIALPDTSEIVGKEGVLRLSERQVFSLDPEVFRARRSLRFAVQCLLQEDIDRDHRLTMVFDEDALRLDLYLLLFQQLGRQHPTLLQPLSLPDRLPEHLSPTYFSEDQLMELMSTVALSALHAQRFDVLHAIAALAESYIHDTAAPAAKIVRIWCSQIDAYILRGGVSGEDPSHRETLDFVRAVREKYFSGVRDYVLSASQGNELEPMQFEAIKADMRLLAREAEVSALTDAERAPAEELYAELERREALLSESFGQHDPIVLSGRVARRYLRFLFRHPQFRRTQGEDIASSDDITAVSKAKDLLSVNISRLRRFSGADRVGVMLDLARLQYLQGNLEVARRWAHAAYVRSLSGNASHSSKLDVFAVYADLNIHLAETDPSHPEYAEIGQRVAGQLFEVAKSLSYLPFRGIAEFLLARCFLLQYDREKPGTKAKRYSTSITEARRRIESSLSTMRSIGDTSFHNDIASLSKSIGEQIYGA